MAWLESFEDELTALKETLAERAYTLVSGKLNGVREDYPQFRIEVYDSQGSTSFRVYDGDKLIMDDWTGADTEIYDETMMNEIRGKLYDIIDDVSEINDRTGFCGCEL